MFYVLHPPKSPLPFRLRPSAAAPFENPARRFFRYTFANAISHSKISAGIKYAQPHNPVIEADCQISILPKLTSCVDYRETATKLQSEWNLEDPQTLEFAPHVGNHALVAVLQRGLLYHEAERLLAQVCSYPVACPALGEWENGGRTVIYFDSHVVVLPYHLPLAFSDLWLHCHLRWHLRRIWQTSGSAQ